MAKVRHPIVCGRRICAACGRWKHAVDFKWRWQNPDATWAPIISSTCVSCLRRRERERYHALPKAKKQNRIKKSVERNRRRARKHEAQVRAARNTAKYHQGGYVDFVPFRMWLLLKARTDDNIARRARVTQSRLNEWLEGCTWNGHYCEPTPIQSIALRTVEDVTTRLGDPGAAQMLYPLEY